MNPLEDRYVHHTEAGGWRVTGTRISLDSIVRCFQDGYDVDTIVRNYQPSISLEQGYGAIAFYLRNREVIEEYLKQQERLFEELRIESSIKNADLHKQLRERYAAMQRNK